MEIKEFQKQFFGQFQERMNQDKNFVWDLGQFSDQILNPQICYFLINVKIKTDPEGVSLTYYNCTPIFYTNLVEILTQN